MILLLQAHALQLLTPVKERGGESDKGKVEARPNGVRPDPVPRKNNRRRAVRRQKGVQLGRRTCSPGLGVVLDGGKHAALGHHVVVLAWALFALQALAVEDKLQWNGV